MNSTFRLLLAAMPDIADACARISDPDLRGRAFDVLVAEAKQGGPDATYSGRYSGNTFTATSDPLTGGYGDPAATRVDNGVRG